MPEILDHGLFDESRQPTGDFEFYRDFFNGEQAEAFVELLKENKVEFKLEKSRTLLEGTITGYGLVPHSVLKLRATDFSLVNRILEEQARNDKDFIANHYFQTYMAAELLEVVQKPDEWTPEDVVVAHHLLDKQGVVIPPEQVENFKQQRIETLMEGKKSSKTRSVVNLLCIILGAVLISPLLLVVGLGMGWYYWQDKTIDSNGNKYFTFDEASRNVGKAIFFLGWVLLGLGILFWTWLPNNFRLF